ncbi:MAG: putative toxin-antitoxin system toxin component, PIN family [Actinomycetota bacterium]|nr:putative toxin-antitoxin system toxin component, PIN family [Actinomycetota bacterium]
MEVVIDVNVLVSATLSGTGASARLIEALRGGRLIAFASDKLIAELGDVLRRDRFRRYLSLDEVEEYVTQIGGLCRPADDPDEVPAFLRDPDDDYLVALAVASGVDAIVSGDLDLREATGLRWRCSRLAKPCPASASDRDVGVAGHAVQSSSVASVSASASRSVTTSMR